MILEELMGPEGENLAVDVHVVGTLDLVPVATPGSALFLVGGFRLLGPREWCPSMSPFLI